MKFFNLIASFLTVNTHIFRHVNSFLTTKETSWAETLRDCHFHNQERTVHNHLKKYKLILVAVAVLGTAVIVLML